MKYLKMLGVAALAAAALMMVAAPASATNLTSPSGTTYTGEIKASAGTMELHGSFVTVKCNKSSLGGKVASHGSGVTEKWTLFLLFWDECNFHWTVIKLGTIEIHWISPNVGTVTWSGGEITIATSIANCIFTSSNTQIGTLTGGTTAKIDINSAGIPRTGHSIFCGSSGTLTGSYTIDTPDTLLVDS
jgi:hypothetical protein